MLGLSPLFHQLRFFLNLNWRKWVTTGFHFGTGILHRTARGFAALVDHCCARQTDRRGQGNTRRGRGGPAWMDEPVPRGPMSFGTPQVDGMLHVRGKPELMAVVWFVQTGAGFLVGERMAVKERPLGCQKVRSSIFCIV